MVSGVLFSITQAMPGRVRAAHAATGAISKLPVVAGPWHTTRLPVPSHHSGASSFSAIEKSLA